MKEYKAHPLSEIFPLMPVSDIKELSDDIKQRGLQNAITLYEGKILDGRHRYEACGIAGVKPSFETYSGNDPIGFVVAANIKRRHLTTSQKAMLAASIANLPHGGDRRSPDFKSANLRPTSTNAADSLAVSERSIDTAKHVLRESPKLAAQVRDGKITVHAAAEKLADKKAEKEAKKDDPRDMENYKIPDEARAVWDRRGEPQEFMTSVSKIKCLIEDARVKLDPLYMRNSQSLIAGLKQVYSLLDECRPYAVCTSCEGRPSVQKHGCGTCGNSGMISRFQWTQASRVEIKAIRQKVIATYK